MFAGLTDEAQVELHWLARRYGIPQPDAEKQVLPVNGSREALFAFAQTVLDPTREAKVVCPNPFYQIYEGAALLAGATPVYGPPESWTGVQLVYTCSPANPSGRVMKLDEWRELFELNRGVVQADGRSLHESNLIRPGWTLRFPADATGLAEPVVETSAPSPVPSPPTPVPQESPLMSPEAPLAPSPSEQATPTTTATTRRCGSPLISSGTPTGPPW